MIRIENHTFELATQVRYLAERDGKLIVGIEIEAGSLDMSELGERFEQQGWRSALFPPVRIMVAELSLTSEQFGAMFGDVHVDELLDTPDGAFDRLASKACRRFVIWVKLEMGLDTPLVEMNDPYLYAPSDPDGPVVYPGPPATAWEQVGWVHNVPKVGDDERYEMWLARFNASLAAWNGSRGTDHLPR